MKKLRALIVPPGASGSLGDQAMMDVVVANLIRSNFTPSVLDHYPGSPLFEVRQKVRQKKYIAGRIKGRLWKTWLSGMELIKADVLCLIGADVMDGVYNPPAVNEKLRLLEIAERLGRPAVIFGASCSDQSNPQITQRLAGLRSTTLLARDPISAERFENILQRPVPLVADLAFLLAPEIASRAGYQAQAWLAIQKKENRTVLGVNVSYHSMRQDVETRLDALAFACRSWLRDDAARALLLIPHDYRGDMNDAVLLERLNRKIGDFSNKVFLPVDPLHAWDVKALVQSTDAIITGRMHLAIAAAGVGAPPLCYPYMGKFDGLMEILGLDKCNLLVEPSVQTNPDRLMGRLNKFIKDIPVIAQSIRSTSSEIKLASESNFNLFRSMNTRVAHS